MSATRAYDDQTQDIILDWQAWKAKVADGTATLADTPAFISGYKPVFELYEDTSLNDLMEWASDPFKHSNGGSYDAVNYQIEYVEDGVLKTAESPAIEFTYGIDHGMTYDILLADALQKADPDDEWTQEQKDEFERDFVEPDFFIPIALLKYYSWDTQDTVYVAALANTEIKEETEFDLFLAQAEIQRHAPGNALEEIDLDRQVSVRAFFAERLSPFYDGLTIEATDDVLYTGENGRYLGDSTPGGFMRERVLTSRGSNVTIDYPIRFTAQVGVNWLDLKSVAIPATLQRLWLEYQQDIKNLGLRTGILEETDGELRYYTNKDALRAAINKASEQVAAVFVDKREGLITDDQFFDQLMHESINGVFAKYLGAPVDYATEYPSVVEEIKKRAALRNALYTGKLVNQTRRREIQKGWVENVRRFLERRDREKDQELFDVLSTKREAENKARLKRKEAKRKEMEPMMRERERLDFIRQQRVERLENPNADSADSDVRPKKRPRNGEAQIRAALKRTGGNVAQAAALLERMQL